MFELKFQKPIETYADNAFDGKKYKLLYTLKNVTNGPKLDEEIEHKISISISDLLLRRWNYQNEDDLFKIFFLFASQLIQTKLTEGNLKEVEKLVLQTNTPNVDIKYDPKKIEDFVDKIYTLDLEEIKRDRNKIKMGFQIPKNKRESKMLPFTTLSRAKKIIDPITLDFYNLKLLYPDKDEHWYLANTWLRRYEKHSKKIYKYYVLPNATIADIRISEPSRLPSFSYIESYQFAILKSPESIGAFSYYLLYKEAPKLSIIFSDSYKKLTESIFKLKEGKKLFSVYKEKNKRTYESFISNPECESHLKSFFLSLELEDKNPKLYNDLLDKIDRSKNNSKT